MRLLLAGIVSIVAAAVLAPPAGAKDTKKTVPVTIETRQGDKPDDTPAGQYGCSSLVIARFAHTTGTNEVTVHYFRDGQPRDAQLDVGSLEIKSGVARGVLLYEERIGPAPVDCAQLGQQQLARFAGQATADVSYNPTPTCNGDDATIIAKKGKKTVGTKGRDVIYGTPGNDTIDGRGGNDLICSGDGNDTLVGGSGNDELHGFPGKDKLYGGSGKDFLAGGYGDDKSYGGAGNDDIGSGYGRDLLDGGSGKDELLGGPDNDRLLGGSGNDRIKGGEDNDRLFGNSGRDVLLGDEGNDTLFGGPGRDKLVGGSGKNKLIQ